MASGVRRLFRSAKKGLIPTISKYGFRRYRTTNSFVRRFGDIYHFVSFAGSQYGGSFYVYITAWVPEMDDFAEPTNDVFRKAMNTVRLGGRLSPRMVGEGTWLWKFGTDEEDEKSLADVTRCIESLAIPWFSCMSDRNQIARALGNNIPSDRKAKIAKPHQPPPEFGIDDSAAERPYPWRPGELQTICDNTWYDEGDDDRFLENGGKNLADAMQERGFELQRAPVFRFIRKKGNYIWVITLEPASDGVHVNSRICTFSKLAAKHVYGRVNAELMKAHYWQVNGGWLGINGIQQFGTTWLIAGRESINRMIPEFLKSVEEYGIPWFDSVSSDKAFLESLNRDYLPASRYASLRKALTKKVEKSD